MEWDLLSAAIAAEEERNATDMLSLSVSSQERPGRSTALASETGGSSANLRATGGRPGAGSRGGPSRRSAAAKKASKAEKLEALQWEWTSLTEALGTTDPAVAADIFRTAEDQVGAPIPRALDCPHAGELLLGRRRAAREGARSEDGAGGIFEFLRSVRGQHMSAGCGSHRRGTGSTGMCVCGCNTLLHALGSLRCPPPEIFQGDCH